MPMRPTHRRLLEAQIRAILDLRRLNKTQAEIAETIGCDQTTVSRWLRHLEDSRDSATAYLRAKALKMAVNVVRKGKPRDHVVALQGLNVLDRDQGKGGVTVIVGGRANVLIAPPAPALPGEPAQAIDAATTDDDEPR
jgi:DNA-binding Lrp family transcriptional regulator